MAMLAAVPIACVLLLAIMVGHEMRVTRELREHTAKKNADADAQDAQKNLALLPTYLSVEEALKHRNRVDPEPYPRAPRIQIVRC